MFPVLRTASRNLFGPLACSNKFRFVEDILVGARRELRTPDADFLQRLTELSIIIDREIGLPISMSPAPSLGSADNLSLDGILPHDLHRLVQRSSPDTPRQIYLDAGLFVFRKGESKDAAVGGCSHLGPHPIVL